MPEKTYPGPFKGSRYTQYKKDPIKGYSRDLILKSGKVIRDTSNEFDTETQARKRKKVQEFERQTGWASNDNLNAAGRNMMIGGALGAAGAGALYVNAPKIAQKIADFQNRNNKPVPASRSKSVRLDRNRVVSSVTTPDKVRNYSDPKTRKTRPVAGTPRIKMTRDQINERLSYEGKKGNEAMAERPPIQPGRRVFGGPRPGFGRTQSSSENGSTSSSENGNKPPRPGKKPGTPTRRIKISDAQIKGFPGRNLNVRGGSGFFSPNGPSGSVVDRSKGTNVEPYAGATQSRSNPTPQYSPTPAKTTTYTPPGQSAVPTFGGKTTQAPTKPKFRGARVKDIVKTAAVGGGTQVSINTRPGGPVGSRVRPGQRAIVRNTATPTTPPRPGYRAGADGAAEAAARRSAMPASTTASKVAGAASKGKGLLKLGGKVLGGIAAVAGASELYDRLAPADWARAPWMSRGAPKPPAQVTQEQPRNDGGYSAPQGGGNKANQGGYGGGSSMTQQARASQRAIRKPDDYLGEAFDASLRKGVNKGTAHLEHMMKMDNLDEDTRAGLRERFKKVQGDRVLSQHKDEGIVERLNAEKAGRGENLLKAYRKEGGFNYGKKGDYFEIKRQAEAGTEYAK